MSTASRTAPAADRVGGLFAGGLLCGALAFGLAAGQAVASGRAVVVIGLAVVIVPVLLWKRPWLAPTVIVVAALAIEQFAPTADPGTDNLGGPPPQPAPVTSHIPLFHGIGALHLSPADLLLVAIFVIYLAKTAGTARSWPRSPITYAVLAVLAAVALAVGVGLMHHGQLRVAFMEVRPFFYLAAAYFLTSVLATTRVALRAVLWGVVFATALKALQGLTIFASIRHMHPRPEAVLGHEEALLFAVFILLVVTLWLYDLPGRLRTTATWILPLVIAADLANNRRSGWLVLGSSLVALGVVGMRSLPLRRHFLVRLMTVLLAVSCVYFPAFWNKSGGLAQPARAIRSAIAPDRRDASSDLYRVQENANLQINIREGGLLGRGFGVPIDYVLPIVDIRSIDPYVEFVPHNGVLYILMRLGILGGVAFWSVIGVAIITGCRLARAADRELGAIGALLAGALVGYTFMGSVDQAFFFYRIALVMGTLLGLGEAARRLQLPSSPAGQRPLRGRPSGESSLGRPARGMAPASARALPGPQVAPAPAGKEQAS